MDQSSIRFQGMEIPLFSLLVLGPIFLLRSSDCYGHKVKVKIGLLQSVEDEEHGLLLEKLVKSYNSNKIVSGRKNGENLVFDQVVAIVSKNDSFLTTKSVCQLVNKKVLAVFGLNLDSVADNAASVLSYLGIPFIQINPSLIWSSQRPHHDLGSSINIFPSRSQLIDVST